MSEALRTLVELLDLEGIEVNIFRGRSPDTVPQRVFGGQVAGQALVAAGRTVPPDRPVHSLHAYFLRPGDARVPIVFSVDRIRDGRSYTTRRVIAVQHGRAIFNLAASFAAPEPGLEHAEAMPAVPDPATLPPWRERLAPYAAELGTWYERPRPIDIRYVTEPPLAARTTGPSPPRSQVWLRADGSLPDDPLVHVCVLTYASDITLLDAVLVRHGPGVDGHPVARGKPRPCDVVPSAVPRRRVVAVRRRGANGVRGAGSRPGPVVRERRTAGGERGPGGSAARARG